MAKIILGNLPSEKIKAAVLRSPRLTAAIKRASITIRKNLKSAFLRGFRRTLLYKGMLYRGPSETSVPAQLGFGGTGESYSAGTAIELITSMFNDLVGNADNKIRRSGRELFLDVNIEDVEAAMANDSRGAYVSENNAGESHTVPWLKWLIEGGTVNGFNILFLSGEKGRKYREYSRSGYAIMVEPTFKQQRGTFSWSIDDYDRFAETENFVQDILEDPSFQKDVEDIIIGAITQELRNV